MTLPVHSIKRTSFVGLRGLTMEEEGEEEGANDKEIKGLDLISGTKTNKASRRAESL